MIREITISFPSGKVYIEHNGHTFDVKSTKRGTPYFLYYGEKQYLTDEETTFIHALVC